MHYIILIVFPDISHSYRYSVFLTYNDIESLETNATETIALGEISLEVAGSYLLAVFPNGISKTEVRRG